ncbi:hypothetical protein JOF56_003400 [Kibdelosporangium banguiense]|uniref:NACHT N-terminal Helical domain-containing protein n=1 Tax=Kibdelosporangium banguiense TaxID=1365924 RepID=A0ABS4TG35_9PSEU|nr:hypothetical protein [Kibdelosporangium banguiense]MBP2323015.1 hypothetical protein [Kibdelosporangium banguiense]
MRTFSYREAAILIGGRQSKLVTALDKATGGIMFGAATVVSDVLSWFDAKADFVRLSHDLVNAVIEAKRGIRRFDRTQRIEAAHTVIVMTAFFEAFEDFDLPFSRADFALTPEDQHYLQKVSSFNSAHLPVGEWLHDQNLLPTPERPYEINRLSIETRYAMMARGLFNFVLRLAVWEQSNEVGREKFRAQVEALPEKALRRYENLFRTLVAEFPEVACWVNMTDHAATRHEVRALGAGLAGLEKILDEIRTGKEPDDRRVALARAYRAQLLEPVLPRGEVSSQFGIPTVERAYVNPRFRVSAVHADSKPSQESWWRDSLQRDDIQQYLVAYLTSTQAASAPLVVLGQPGAGKSMLTKVLAARLPASDFLPIRVELRDVPAEADIQDQIEHAIRQATGDRVEWTDLAGSTGDAIPVILLDGFDELLQATGAQHIDYLTRVAQFQKREADQERPLAVIVTTRIAVAGLARFPGESIALRLEPFDRNQVEQWVGIWNSENRGYFARSGVASLAPEAVLAYPELATQPLLLLMLALYDGDKNALQGSAGTISQSDLYEGLLVQFARREVTKAKGQSDDEIDRAVESELRRLSYVAFAMFNRGAQWVTQEDLNRDLVALLGETAGSASGLRRQLSDAEIAIGRFFFIHRARAQQAEKSIETFEFLHATFAEYLVARMAWKLVQALVAREAAVEEFFDRPPLDDSMLHALLSFAPLSTRAAAVRFLAEIPEQLTVADRQAMGEILIRLFRIVDRRRSAHGRDSYEPRSASMSRRHANYSANLVILVTALLGEIRASQLYGRKERAMDLWQADALLWRSQIDYYSMVNALSVEKIWAGRVRDIVLRLSSSGMASRVALDWSYQDGLVFGRHGLRSFFHTDSLLLRRQNFFASAGDDVFAHLAEPVVEYLPGMLTGFGDSNEGVRSIANMALTLLLNPVVENGEDIDWVYLWCAKAAGSVTENSPELRTNYADLVVSRMCVDQRISPQLVVDIFELLGVDTVTPSVAVPCVVRFLGWSDDTDRVLLDFYTQLKIRITDPVEEIVLRVEVNLRITELGIDPGWELWDEFLWRANLRELADSGRRPELVKRGEWLLSHYYGSATEG